ncbi:ankyrin repeat [Trichoderma arundinaceum]|uniref:Ankyrin repeat n=1 Tax=Trichoderma arundinaceum TaxID=490622 RepID=A0A395NE59_TRIAR|nr:ankyrin repeat [Trichoderma arundinaceum]
MAQSLLFSVFLMLWLPDRASADGGDDFANNLASDLGPIIALFGERVVMQFMSQSMGIADFILLAVAPIGAITIVVSAIRVAGPAWLKSFIGRARENTSAAEIEIMSSTSKEVCELWNGQSVVRCPGSADICQFICLIPKGLGVETLSKSQTSFQYETLEHAKDKELLVETSYAWKCFKKDAGDAYRRLNKNSTRRSDIERGSSSQAEPTITIVVDDSKDNTPNLLLNCHDKVGRGEIYLAATLGVILQLGALVYFGIITYYRPVRDQFLKNDRRAVSYAFPCATAGTILLTWNWSSEFVTSTGALISLMGFISQFIGMRGLNWTASVVQLSITIVSTYELEWLALGLGDLPNAPWATLKGNGEDDSKGENPRKWRIRTGGEQVYPPLQIEDDQSETHSVAHKIMVARRELGEYSEWKSQTFEEATRLANAIEAVANTFLPREQGAKYRWILPATYETKASNEESSDEKIYIQLTHDGSGWKVDHGMIEAILSLWLYSSPKLSEDGRRGGLRLYGPSRFKQRLAQDLKWWMPETSPELFTIKDADIKKASSVVGFTGIKGMNQPSEQFLAVKCQDMRGRIFSRDLLFSFIRAVAKMPEFTMERVTSPPQMSHNKMTESREHLKMNSGDISSLARKLEKIGLGTRSDVYFDLIVPLSLELKLTNVKDLIDEANKQAQQYEMSLEWKKLVDTCAYLLHLAQSFDLEKESSGPLAIAVCLEFLKKLRHEALLQRSERRDAKELKLHLATLEREFKKFEEFRKTTTFSKSIILPADEIILPADGRQYAASFKVLIKPFTDNTTPCPDSFQITEEHEKVIKKSKSEEVIDTRDFKGLGETDAFSWSPLHYAAYLRSPKIYTGSSQRDNHFNHRDFMGWTPLQHACLNRNEIVVDMLLAHDAPIAIAANDGITPMHCAVRGGNANILQKLIEKVELERPDTREVISRGDRNNRYPIHWAVIQGHIEMVRLLKDDINFIDRFGWTALHLAAIYGHDDILKDIIEDGQADINKGDNDSRTALHLAVEFNSPALARQLIEAGADVNAQAKDGSTPLHIAVKQQSLSLFDFFVKAGVDVDVKTTGGLTALHVAAEGQSLKFAKKLIEAGADVDAQTKNSLTPLHIAIEKQSLGLSLLLLEKKAKVDIKAKGGLTPLHIAAKNGSLALARALCKAGADVNAKAKDGSTPLHMAVGQKNTLIVQTLLENNVEKEATDIKGRTPLFRAVVDGNVEVATLLIDAGANVAAVADGRTSLHVALNHGVNGFEVAERLLQAVEKPRAKALYADMARTTDGATPLHIAAERRPMRAVEMLINAGANINAIDKDGQTPLLIAMKNKRWDIAKCLLKAGADAKADSRNGDTPLLGAVMGGKKSIVRQLLDAKVDVNAADRDGRSPLHHAAILSDCNIIQILLEAGANIDAFQGSTNQAALRSAIREGNWETVLSLLQNTASTH